MTPPVQFFFLLVLVTCATTVRAVETGAPVPGSDLAIHLSVANEVMTVSTYPEITITLINHGTRKATLVLPGDGSERGWRTPIIGWAVKSSDDLTPYPKEVPLNTRPRCGDMNALERSEIISLDPGTSVTLSSAERPRLITPGRFHIRFYYLNVPNCGWNGGDLGHASDDAMQAMRASTPCFIISDELSVTVIGRPNVQEGPVPLPDRTAK